MYALIVTDDKKEDKTAIPCINIVSAPSPSQTSPDIQPDLQGDDIVLEESEAGHTHLSLSLVIVLYHLCIEFYLNLHIE